MLTCIVLSSFRFDSGRNGTYSSSSLGLALELFRLGVVSIFFLLNFSKSSFKLLLGRLKLNFPLQILTSARLLKEVHGHVRTWRNSSSRSFASCSDRRAEASEVNRNFRIPSKGRVLLGISLPSAFACASAS